MPEQKLKQLRDHGRPGYPLGSAVFIAGLEKIGLCVRGNPGGSPDYSNVQNEFASGIPPEFHSQLAAREINNHLA